ncbi:MAG: DNA recombination protein RmuC [Acidobacteriota bacterium]
MTQTLLVALVGATGVAVALLVAVLGRLRGSRPADAGGILSEELRAGRAEASETLRGMREELARGQAASQKTVSETLAGLSEIQKGQLEGLARQLERLTGSNRELLDKIRATLDARVRELQEGNEKRLNEMRQTVDEKLEKTLEKRLGESFKLVSDRLEKVHQGLGEMQTLAAGVGDLKKVLTNVKVRGTWAEVQLGAILDQILTPDQFDRNVQTRPESRENVEYAVRLPGPRDDPHAVVWLPIDSKFPQEDYVRLQEAADRGDAEAVQKASFALARAVRTAAQDIHDKYVEPPSTTDFAIMYLATEGLYAEVLRQPGLMEELQQKHRVVVAGPTTVAAILSSLRMGFQTLAIERRAGEVWTVLAAVKTEFGKFGQVMEKVKKQIGTVSRTLEETGVRTRAMEKRLRSVEQLPGGQAAALLDLPGVSSPPHEAPAGTAEVDPEASRPETAGDDPAEIDAAGRPDPEVTARGPASPAGSPDRPHPA